MEVQRVMEDERRGVAQRLAQKQSGFDTAGQRLHELLRYREEYLQRYQQAASAGLVGTQLRDYQSFLAKLDQAVRQQQDLLARARAETEFERDKLRDVNGQIAAVGGVASRWSADERRVDERREQRHSDEHGQRSFLKRQSEGAL
jgi:flagellar FliJ protein